jgi:hypothetical protein
MHEHSEKNKLNVKDGAAKIMTAFVLHCTSVYLVCTHPNSKNNNTKMSVRVLSSKVHANLTILYRE